MARRNNQNNQANNDALNERNKKMKSVFEKSYSDYKTFKKNVLDNVFTQYRYEELSEDFTKRDAFQKFVVPSFRDPLVVKTLMDHQCKNCVYDCQ